MLLRLLKHRRPLQVVLLAVAILVVAHGFLGPQLAPRNAATVLTWVHYRGLLIGVLLAVGNLFCTACPMILVRDAGRTLWHPKWRWPRSLRSKWPAIVLFAAILFAYERFDLWQLPMATASLVLAYFAAALVVDVLFSGATFCKHLCPIGQFNFITSTISPTELRPRSLDVCRACTTVDCIKGRLAPVPQADPVGADLKVRPYERAVLQRGCELALFMPTKVGNLDCTLCGDCVRACPHDNITLATRVPGAELLDVRRRSGIGRLVHRPDIAALITLFTAAAVVNALAMTTAGDAIGLNALFAAGLIVVPIGATLVATFFTRAVAETRQPFRHTAIHYVATLAPLGVGIWAAHYGFHFLTGLWTAIPVVQAAIIDLSGAAALGEPLWQWVGLPSGVVFPIQLGFVLLGATGSLALAHAVSTREVPGRAWIATAPWAALIGALTAAAIWILGQPMAMRGVGFSG
jgi:polyferredoxin